MYYRLIRRLQISIFLIFFLFCSAAISYSEGTAGGQDRSDTKHIFIQTGVVTLNPYKIKKDPTDDKFKLSPSGETDTYAFVEALIRERTAWLDTSKFESGWHFFLPDDYEAKLSFYGIKDSKRSPESAVVSGSGDAGGEVSVGWVILPSLAGEIKHTLNIEGIYGVIADKTVLNLHNYYGFGIVSVWGIPRNNRNIEALAGIYSKIIQVPEFVNNSSLEVKTSNEYPVFIYRNALSLRLNIKIPYGDNGFLTFGGDFNNVSKTDNSFDLRGDSPITNSWSASLGITTHYEKLLEIFK